MDVLSTGEGKLSTGAVSRETTVVRNAAQPFFALITLVSTYIADCGGSCTHCDRDLRAAPGGSAAVLSTQLSTGSSTPCFT
jgi:hypothetical protein